MTEGGIAANIVCPGQNGLEVAGKLGRNQRYGTEHNDSLSTVDGNHVTLMKNGIGALYANLLFGGIDAEGLNTADARSAHAARNDGSMAGLATVAREDALCGNHALEVIGIGFPANEDARLARLCARDGIIGREDDLAHGGAGACIEAASENIDLGRGVKLRMEQLIELRRIDA